MNKKAKTENTSSKASSSLVSEVEDLATPICDVHGLELVEVKALAGKKETTFRVTIDRERHDDRDGSGVSLGDCQNVSRDLTTALEVLGGRFDNLAYRIEVSSPGVERPLVRLKDYTRFSGKEAKLKTFAPVDGQRSFIGIIEGTDGEAITIAVGSSSHVIEFSNIAKANLVFRF